MLTLSFVTEEYCYVDVLNFPFKRKKFYFKGALTGQRQLFETESSVKMMKNAFYLTLNLFSFSRYLNFCLDFLVMQKNGLIRKIRLTQKFMTSEPGKQLQYTYSPISQKLKAIRQ